MLSRPRVRQKAQSGRGWARVRVHRRISSLSVQTAEISQNVLRLLFLPKLAATARSAECDQPLCLSALSAPIWGVTWAERTSHLSRKIITHKQAHAGGHFWIGLGEHGLVLQCSQCRRAAESSSISKSRLPGRFSFSSHMIGCIEALERRWCVRHVSIHSSVIRQSNSYWHFNCNSNAVLFDHFDLIYFVYVYVWCFLVCFHFCRGSCIFVPLLPFIVEFLFHATYVVRLILNF